MTIQQKAIEFAIMEYDANAGEEGENNSGPFVHKYLNGLAEPPANWCAAFVCWCVKEACESLSKPMPFEYTLSARRLFNIFKGKGWILNTELVKPQCGDIIFFWRVDINHWTGHIGFVLDLYDKETGVNSWKKEIITIEGNKGFFPAHVNRYKYDYYNVPKLLGYGRIKEA